MNNKQPRIEKIEERVYEVVSSLGNHYNYRLDVLDPQEIVFKINEIIDYLNQNHNKKR